MACATVVDSEQLTTQFSVTVQSTPATLIWLGVLGTSSMTPKFIISSLLEYPDAERHQVCWMDAGEHRLFLLLWRLRDDEFFRIAPME